MACLSCSSKSYRCSSIRSTSALTAIATSICSTISSESGPTAVKSCSGPESCRPSLSRSPKSDAKTSPKSCPSSSSCLKSRSGSTACVCPRASVWRAICRPSVRGRGLWGGGLRGGPCGHLLVASGLRSTTSPICQTCLWATLIRRACWGILRRSCWVLRGGRKRAFVRRSFPIDLRSSPVPVRWWNWAINDWNWWYWWYRWRNRSRSKHDEKEVQSSCIQSRAPWRDR